MNEYLPLLIGLLFLSGILVTVLYPVFKQRLGWVLSLVPLTVFIFLLIWVGELDTQTIKIFPSDFTLLPGIDFSFRLDGLSLIFGLLISGIGFLVVLYASWYMKKYPRQGRFFSYLMFFMAAMIGLVFSDNLMALFIFWELTSVTSFLLIGFDHHLEKSRQAALQSLLITGFGGLCLLFASILIGQIAGTYQISELISGGIDLTSNPQYSLIFSLLLAAVLTKSAQFPFHFWLPGAMQAPTPVSAYLHSATMVNAGIFLLLRMHPLVSGTVLWKYSLILAGVITMFLGAWFSMGQKDLKRILAFTTISALGTMVLLIGIGTPLSMEATMVFFIVHGLYKGGLFMVAGIIDKSTGTRDISVLSRIWKPLPATTIFAVLALVSMAGLPPMLGFVGKELVYVAKIQLPGLSWIILPLGVGANIMMVAISLTVFAEVFYTRSSKPEITIRYTEKKLPWYFIFGPGVLALTGLLLGLFPGGLNQVIANALYVTKNQVLDVHLLLWHGFNEVLLLSIFAVLLGVLIFVFRKPVTRLINNTIRWFDIYHLPTIFMNVMNHYLRIAGKNTQRIQHGYHRYYLMTFFLVTLAITAFQINWNFSELVPLEGFTSIRLNIVILLMVSALAVLFAVFSMSRLSAILAMGVVGYGIGLLYLLYGAIDLAITQFLAETVIMVLFVMVIYYLPKFAKLSSRKSRVRDIIISLAVGAGVTIVVLHSRALNNYEPISSFFAENSLLKAHGRNIVNVILVDFRALDTLGEITVLTLAAIGVYSLFRFTFKRRENP
ncbi:MAG: hydrogen gas-evolving membrane-bound hydrogenase subunit E [Bacteroidales bacterium]|jgi:multicomponent Na+:H+ antiporter subunit A|nr:hydrogen gas-evolving membrane-bound hydrogenase subunit E [Bacteroidales bacterium]